MTDATGEAVKLLIAERDRINQAISLLQGDTPQEAPRRRGRPPGSKNAPKTGDAAAATPAKKKKRGRRQMTAAEKEIVSNRMKAYWAARRRAAKRAKKK